MHGDRLRRRGSLREIERGQIIDFSWDFPSSMVDMTCPPKLDGFQLEEIASFCPSAILTELANSIGVRFPIELWGRCSL